ncbi:hypothetical protein LB505_007415 [Fusarium chuoi]|nr:hypothetical protein LB505_007415 [Fusarium chuoi]
MALGKKPYPKATVKKIIKAHSNHNLKKNADVTIFLDYVLFMETYESDESLYTTTIQANYIKSLIKEAAIHSKQSGERGLSARSVKKVTRVCLVKHLLSASADPCCLGYLDQIQGLNKAKNCDK